jgi:DNA-binding winged helix-turn-helix (wHTH) protein
LRVNGTGRLRFGDYELDSRSGKLFRDGWPVKIQPQPLRVLGVLLERPGEIIPREQLRARIWGDATFVEFDQGLNYCIRQIRLALRDGPSEPLYIETLPKQGYRFIANVVASQSGTDAQSAARERAGAQPILIERAADPGNLNRPDPAPLSPVPLTGRPPTWVIALGVCVVLTVAGIAVYRSFRSHPAGLRYTQITDFTDSAVAPALSPDGRLVAFIRGSSNFPTADQVYVKVLPDGKPGA